MWVEGGIYIQMLGGVNITLNGSVYHGAILQLYCKTGDARRTEEIRNSENIVLPQFESAEEKSEQYPCRNS